MNYPHHKPSSQKIWLCLILLIGLGLRLCGLQWGLTSHKTFFHGSSYHPDEQAMFNALKQLSWHKKQFYPTEISIIMRGSLQVYAVAAAFGAMYPWIPVSRDREFYKKNPDALQFLYTIARSVSVMQSLAAILALFWLGTLLYHWRVGMGAALLMAIAPVHVVNAHYISTDAAFSLYLISLLIACTTILKSAHIRNYLIAGLFWGLLAANKYNAASTGLILFSAHFLSKSPTKKNWFLLAAMGAAGLAFSLGNPSLILGFQDLAAALRLTYKINMNIRLFMYDAGYPTNGVRFYSWNAFLYGLGLPLFLSCIAALIYSVRRFSRTQWLWLPWSIFFLLMLMNSAWRLVRWIIPLTPLLFLEVSRMWNDEEFWGRWKLLRHPLAMIVIAYTTLYSFSYVHEMSKPDMRDVSSNWITTHIPKGSRIALRNRPYFWTPGIFQSASYHADEAEELKQTWGYDMFYIRSLKELHDNNPEYVILTCYDTNIYLQNPTYFQGFDDGQFIAELLNPEKYTLMTSFEKQLRVGDRTWFGNTFNFPHDWRYPFPKILVLKKRA